MYNMTTTHHAQRRWLERVGHGDMLEVARKSSKAGKGLRKRIAEGCPYEGASPDFDYFYNDLHLPNKRIVFVLRRTPERDWIIVTVWTYERNKEQL